MLKDLSFFLAREMDIEDATCFLDKFAIVLVIYNMHEFTLICADNIHTCNTLQFVQDNTETVHGYTQADVPFLCGRHLQIMDWLLPLYTPAFRLRKC